MRSPSAPKPPDPIATAGAQTGMNIGTGIAEKLLGNVNQITPYGNLNYNQTGSTTWNDPLTGKTFNIPQFTATQTMSPQQQGLYNAQTAAGTNAAQLAATQTQKLGSILGKPVNMGAAPKVNQITMDKVGQGPSLNRKIGPAGPITRGIDDAGAIRTSFGYSGPITRSYGDDAGYSDQRQRVENALMARMNPGLEQERSRLTAQLANQGIQVGSEAYDREMRNYGQRTNDARMGAILGAGEEQSRLAGLDQNRAQFQNSAQQQAYNQLLGRGQFGNQAQAQAFGQNAQQAQFGNQAQQQAFNQGTTRATFGNDALQQMFQNRMAGTGFNNQAAQQQYQNQTGARKDWLSEQYAARNQPINEIAALLGTGQVQNPNFMNAQGPAVANTDYAGLVGNNYNQRMQQWQMQQQQQQSLLGGLFGLGSAGIMAL